MTSHDGSKLTSQPNGKPSLPGYSQLRLLTTLRDQPIDTAMEQAAQLVDSASQAKSDTDLEHALTLINELQDSGVTSDLSALLHYFAANVWHGLRLIRYPTVEESWAWQQPEMENELLELRTARNSDGFVALTPYRKAQILTNTGNLLSVIGRSLEAVVLYDEALTAAPEFGMALLNKGVALLRLADLHYDAGQRTLLARAAYQAFQSTDRSQLENGAEPVLDWHIERIESALNKEVLDSEFIPKQELDGTPEEQSYRRWALYHQLFLNPLNVLGVHAIAARDTIVLPNIVTRIDEGPGLLGMFAQIKQEYVSARFLAWEGETTDEPHFSDKDTYLFDTLDYPVYGLAIEKTKIAFRMAYSILDKCAYLMNKYFGLGIPENKVSFSRVWYTGGIREKGFNPQLMDTANGPMRGLYWLSRDLYEDGSLSQSLLPEAQQLKEIRDHAEHRYLRVNAYSTDKLNRHPGLDDQYARSIGRHALVLKTLTLLRLASTAMIYLSMGIHVEESSRKSQNPERKVAQLFGYNVPDHWKR